MNTSSLAARLEEYEAQVESLKLTHEPATRIVVPQGALASAESAPRAPRRALRTGGIKTSDQGLRPFRVS